MAPRVRRHRRFARATGERHQARCHGAGVLSCRRVAAHALDELKGHPLKTGIPDWALSAVAAVALAGAVALGIAGVIKVGWVLVPFLVIGPVLVVGYCSELMGGVLHNDLTFGIAWGAFPVLTAYVAQTDRITDVAVLAALAALAFSVAQRMLSTPARLLRRQASTVEGSVELTSGAWIALDRRTLLIPLERALRAMAGAMVLCLRRQWRLPD